MLNVEKIILFTKNHMSTRKKRLGQARKRHENKTKLHQYSLLAVYARTMLHCVKKIQVYINVRT